VSTFLPGSALSDTNTLRTPQCLFHPSQNQQTLSEGHHHTHAGYRSITDLKHWFCEYCTLWPSESSLSPLLARSHLQYDAPIYQGRQWIRRHRVVHNRWRLRLPGVTGLGNSSIVHWLAASDIQIFIDRVRSALGPLKQQCNVCRSLFILCRRSKLFKNAIVADCLSEHQRIVCFYAKHYCSGTEQTLRKSKVRLRVRLQ